jgi:hypothetical protein
VTLSGDEGVCLVWTIYVVFEMDGRMIRTVNSRVGCWYLVPDSISVGLARPLDCKDLVLWLEVWDLSFLVG